ncbi:hypothetical protein [Halobacterium rubrum]|uniref:hypothetical protein n=1 Tax=Halobacterium TaxID=2239 RepID=UPI001F405939|nr:MULTISPECIES: hypothetical protein [Halobacterium]MDH5020375.1 hypothetical protein [Halobacterium rubrum]
MSSDGSKSKIGGILVAALIGAIFVIAMVYNVNLGWDTIADLISEIPQNPQSKGGAFAGLFAVFSSLGYIADVKLRGK